MRIFRLGAHFFSTDDGALTYVTHQECLAGFPNGLDRLSPDVLRQCMNIILTVYVNACMQDIIPYPESRRCSDDVVGLAPSDIVR